MLVSSCLALPPVRLVAIGIPPKCNCSVLEFTSVGHFFLIYLTVVKFRYSEKAAKFKDILICLTLLINFKKIGRFFFQIIVEYLNFRIIKIDFFVQNHFRKQLLNFSIEFWPNIYLIFTHPTRNSCPQKH